MIAGDGAGITLLQQLLDQVDAPTGAVALVPGVEIGRAGGKAETAVHAGADQCTGLFCAPVVGEGVVQFYMHAYIQL